MDERVDVRVRIRGVLPSLQPAEQRVAQAVLSDPAGAAGLSISALAASAHTSTATVMRFCRSVGLTSYPELRLALASAAGREEARVAHLRPVRGDLDLGDTLAEVVAKIAYHEARSLEETAAQLDLDSLAAAVDAVRSARRVDIFGVGASGLVGQDLHQKLHRIGLIAFVWTETHSALTAAGLLGPADVAVAVSHSGATTDTIEPLRVAHERGATTIALTNFNSSPLTVVADLVLTTAVREMTLRSAATASRIAQLAVVDCLFVGVAQRGPASTDEALAGTYDAVRGRRLPTPGRGAPQ